MYSRCRVGNNDGTSSISANPICVKGNQKPAKSSAAVCSRLRSGMFKGAQRTILRGSTVQETRLRGNWAGYVYTI